MTDQNQQMQMQQQQQQQQQVPQDNGQTQAQATTGTGGEFGEPSDFGQRLDYSAPKYNDLWAGILFYAHVLTMLIVGIVMLATLKVQSSDDSSTTTTFTFGTTTTEKPAADDGGAGTLVMAVLVTLLIQVIVGICFGLVWLQMMKMFAEYIIKGLLFFNMFCWLVLAVFGLIVNLIGLVVFAAIGLLWICLYTWCVWSRIPFASALLSIASAIASTYEGTIVVSLMTCVMDFLWFVIWIIALFAYAVSDVEINMFFIFLYLVSFYWGFNVFRNVSHTTTCGVAATWYFSAAGSNLHKPSMSAFKRTMTTSFGSVCFGSLIVAILQATRSIFRGMKRGPCVCIAICFLACIECLLRYFNMYAFAQCAIYGSTFIQAAKATWNLLWSKGIDAVINDDLTGLALSCGAFFGFVVSAVVGYFVGSALAAPLGVAVSVLVGVIMAIYGGFVGYGLCVLVLLVVRSGVVALFVCFAEDPAALKVNRPASFDRLTGSHDGMRQVGEGNVFDPDGKRAEKAQQTAA